MLPVLSAAKYLHCYDLEEASGSWQDICIASTGTMIAAHGGKRYFILLSATLFQLLQFRDLEWPLLQQAALT